MVVCLEHFPLSTKSFEESLEQLPTLYFALSGSDLSFFMKSSVNVMNMIGLKQER